MIRTKFYQYSIKDIPDTWIFEYYCQLTQKLCGQRLMIKSIFNPTETMPSMALFVGDNGRYRFKDFSTGIAGDSIALVSFINDKIKGSPKLFTQVCDEIVMAFVEYTSKGGEYLSSELDPKGSYKLKSYRIRQWNTIDANFWSNYWISSNTLHKYHVFPLDEYIMERDRDIEDSFQVGGNFLYGYFTKDGDLYKIYQPTSTRKFLKISDHIQGLEQLKYDKDILLVTSSLKDGMSIERFDIPLEFIAVHSENTILRAAAVDKFRRDYKYIFTLFDNDEAGIKARDLYLSTYNIPSLVINIEKDISDAIKKYTPDVVKPIFQRELNKLLLSCVRNSTSVLT